MHNSPNPDALATGKASGADRDQLTSWIDALFRYADPAGYVQFRCFWDKGEPRDGVPMMPWKSVRVGEPDLLLSTAVAVASEAAGHESKVVFCPPVCTFKRPYTGRDTGREEDVLEGLAVSTEIDTASPSEALRQLTGLLGVPTVVLHSGGVYENPLTGESEDKLHLHWRLTEPARTADELTVLKECRRLCAIIAAGDASNVPFVHPVRWAGSWHRKATPRLAWGEYEPTREVELVDAFVALRSAERSEAALRDAVPALQREAPALGSSPRGGARVRAAGDDTPPIDVTVGHAALEDVLAALAVVPNPDHDWKSWKQIGAATLHGIGNCDAGRAAFHTFSAKSLKYDRAFTDKTWDELVRYPYSEITVASLFAAAAAADPTWYRPSLRRERARRRDEEMAAAMAAADAAEGGVLHTAKRGAAADAEPGETAVGKAEPADPGLDAYYGFIRDLATKSEKDYQFVRDDAAHKLGLGKSALDQVIKAERSKLKAVASESSVIRLNVGSHAEIAHRVATIDMPAAGHYVFDEGSFYAFDQVWSVVPDWQIVERFLLRYDGARSGERGVFKFTEPVIRSVKHILSAKLTTEDFFEKGRRGIAVQNGFIEFQDDGTYELVPHHPDQRCRTLLPGSWQPWNGLPKESRLYKFWFELLRFDAEFDEKLALFQEVAGAALLGSQRRLRQPKALVVLGRGNNGKSKVVALFEGLMGKGNFSNVSVTDFVDPNIVIRLRGKPLNLSDDLGYADSVRNEHFKRVITSDPIEGKILFQDKVSFRPVAQHMFTTNKLPSFGGGIDPATRRRLMVMELQRELPESNMIEEVETPILQYEYDLILNWAIEGAARLLRNKKFGLPSTSDELLDAWVRDSDAVSMWIKERVRHNPLNEDGYKPSDAYAKFKHYAIHERHHDEKRLVKLAEFVHRMGDHFQSCRRNGSTNRFRQIEILDHDVPDAAEIARENATAQRSAAIDALWDGGHLNELPDLID